MQFIIATRKYFLTQANSWPPRLSNTDLRDLAGGIMTSTVGDARGLRLESGQGGLGLRCRVFSGTGTLWGLGDFCSGFGGLARGGQIRQTHLHLWR